MIPLPTSFNKKLLPLVLCFSLTITTYIGCGTSTESVSFEEFTHELFEEGYVDEDLIEEALDDTDDAASSYEKYYDDECKELLKTIKLLEELLSEF